MTGRIVVGIDGSAASGKALDWAIARAALGGQELDLVHAYSPPVDFNFYGYQSIAGPETLQWHMDHSHSLVESAEAHVREVAPDLVCTLKSDLGPAADLLGVIGAGADAIVVGRRGLGAAASAFLGSVSNRLTTQAPCPVIVVGEGELPTTGPIVVGVDGSEFGAAAFRYAVAEAALRKTSVRAVTAHHAPAVPMRADPELIARLEEAHATEAENIIHEAVDEIRTLDDRSVPIEAVTVQSRAAEGILAQAHDAQLVVVGPHGKGLVRRFVIGSVSRQLLQEADRPVAVVDVPGSGQS